MGTYEPLARLVWSLEASGKGTTITAAGDSGPWDGLTPSQASAVDLRWITDVGLYVYTGAPAGTTPSLTVQLDVFDDEGNLYPAVIKTAAITAAGAAAPVYGGLHGPAAGSYAVLPQWGRVSWTVSGAGATFPDVEIALYGR